jgi:serine/threonine-protein kinase ULK/ATG1
LDVILKKRKRLPIAEAEKIFKNILKGVEYLISQKVMHRDLKPSNILLHNGQYKIADFGLAKREMVHRSVV